MRRVSLLPSILGHPSTVASPQEAFKRLPETAPWYIALTDEFINAVSNIDRTLQRRILEAIGYLSRTLTLPAGDTVIALARDLTGLWHYRLGDSRFMYRPEFDNGRVVLVAFTHGARHTHNLSVLTLLQPMHLNRLITLTPTTGRNKFTSMFTKGNVNHRTSGTTCDDRGRSPR